MQEVFEKIIEKLKNLGCVFADYYPDGTNISRVSKKSVPYDEVVEIVKQEAEKHNNGWIPCSERLPEEYTVLCCDKYGEMIIGHPYFDEVSDTNYSSESDNEMMYNCVAWQPLPQPYHPKGE